ncbi:hypothetical protein [Sphaerisporangium sp. TRM90804]|uniref:hypothetical protein n=1 Tax=Sphaerisporangium sp. TRM90804 TaxID=3031113 RepID=UPI00244C00F5|nr:hypothetical protein [Sphaerisporangium sp. TRM90804]MDH2425736.1 hypothetical protein [Sphaerisporangium sp. TRM90804]
MIVEDEDGNDIDLRDLADDREPEPPDDPPPLDLDEIEALYQAALGESVVLGQHGMTVMFNAVPELLARLRAAEAELAELRGWEHRYEYVVTLGAEPAKDHPFAASAESAEWMRVHPECGTPWVRDVTTSPWRRYEPPPEPPF